MNIDRIEKHLHDMLSFLRQCKDGEDVSKLVFLLGKQFSRLTVEEQGEFVYLWSEKLMKNDDY